MYCLALTYFSWHTKYSCQVLWKMLATSVIMAQIRLQGSILIFIACFLFSLLFKQELLGGHLNNKCGRKTCWEEVFKKADLLPSIYVLPYKYVFALKVVSDIVLWVTLKNTNLVGNFWLFQQFYEIVTCRTRPMKRITIAESLPCFFYFCVFDLHYRTNK